MKKILSVLIVSFVILANHSLAYAVGSGGFMDQVVGARALGAGNAFVAQADDTSAIYFNPAGLIQLPGTQISLGSTFLTVDTEYTSTTGQKDELKDMIHTVPNFYVTHRLQNEKWAAGIGINSPFGLSTEWSKTGQLRYVATKSLLQTININPTVSFQASPKWSIGFGLDYLLVDKVQLERQLNVTAINAAIRAGFSLPPAGIYSDGGFELEGDGGGWGYNFGLLFKPVTQHQIGLAYRSEINTTLEGKAKLSGLADESAAAFGGSSYETGVKAPFDFPQSILTGYAFKPNDKWIFEFDYEWVGWSENKETALDFSETDPGRRALLNNGNPTPRSWKDSNNIGLGTNYKFNNVWEVRGGYWFFERVSPNRTFDPAIPENTRNTITLGGSANLSSVTVDLAYNAIFFRDRDVDNTVGSTSGSSVNGTYESFGQLVALNLTYKFGL